MNYELRTNSKINIKSDPLPAKAGLPLGKGETILINK